MEFTYSSYKKMIESIINNGFTIANYNDYFMYEKVCILRHDIDNSLEKALKLAQIEYEMGVKSTYFVLISSDFYNVFSKKSKEMLLKIKEYGHDIGLHFDEVKYQDKDKSNIDVVELIKKECAILSKELNIEIKSVSMHRPSEKTLMANYKMDGIINSYGEVFYKDFKYISDSRRFWRENPFDAIEKFDKIHILTHAFWYDEIELTQKQSVLNFINSANEERKNSLYDNITNLDEILE